MHGQGVEAKKLARSLLAQHRAIILVELRAWCCTAWIMAPANVRNGPLIISHGALSGVRHKGNDLDSQNSTA